MLKDDAALLEHGYSRGSTDLQAHGQHALPRCIHEEKGGGKKDDTVQHINAGFPICLLIFGMPRHGQLANWHGCS